MLLNQVLNLIDEKQKVLSTEKINIKDAHKRVLAQDIISFHDYPPFNRSTKDGFAVIAKDTSVSKSFKIIDEIGAGDFSTKIVKENEAIIVATGSPIPEGADAVIMKEFSKISGSNVLISSEIVSGENISFKSENIKKGDIIFSKNTFIGYHEIGLIASAGYNEIEVFKIPNVKLIITGNELVEPSKNLDNAKIINSNQFTIASLINDSGANVDVTYCEDNIKLLSEVLDNASKVYDLIITTGGTAISKGDIIFNTIDKLGKILFHGVDIRPGKLMGLGLINESLVFCLSGQPIAAITQFDIFIRKYLFKLQGRDFKFDLVTRESSINISSKIGYCDFIRVISDDNYVLNKTSNILNSNSYVIIDENMDKCQKGDLVKVFYFNSMVW